MISKRGQFKKIRRIRQGNTGINRHGWEIQAPGLCHFMINWGSILFAVNWGSTAREEELAFQECTFSCAWFCEIQWSFSLSSCLPSSPPRNTLLTFCITLNAVSTFSLTTFNFATGYEWVSAKNDYSWYEFKWLPFGEYLLSNRKTNR